MHYFETKSAYKYLMYKQFQIPDYAKISKKIYEYILTNTSIVKDKNFWTAIGPQNFSTAVPEIVEFFDALNLKFRCVGVVYVDSKSDVYQLMHIDSAKEIRGLLPIKNCEGSYTKFFDYGDQELLEFPAAGDETYFCPKDPTLCKEIGKLELTTPAFIDTSILHSVQVNPDIKKYRLSVTLGFTEPPTNLSFYNL